MTSLKDSVKASGRKQYCKMSIFDFPTEARGYQRKVDRRRSQTFKSITVPDEVLQVAADDQIPEEDDDDDDLDEYGELMPRFVQEIVPFCFIYAANLLSLLLETFSPSSERPSGSDRSRHLKVAARII